jgi:dTMP kinase
VFITFEGIDRSGKSTQARLLADALGERAVLVREPGGTEAAERIRALVKDRELTLSPTTETLLFAAARSDLVSVVIRPALESGKIVICDRYGDSTAAYQGGARGIGIERVEELNAWATGDLVPDVTFLLDVPIETAGGRDGERDRFEDEGAELQRGVASAYERLAALHNERFVRVDGSRSPDKVHAEILAAVESRIGVV